MLILTFYEVVSLTKPQAEVKGEKCGEKCE